MLKAWRGNATRHQQRKGYKMSKPATLTIWKIDTPAGYEFFPTRRQSKASIDQMIEEGYLTGFWANQKPQKHTVELWSGRSLMDALFEGIRIGQAYRNDEAW